MAPPEKTRPLPKFGEWDVNNPSSAEGFTGIFNRAREEKRANGTAVGTRQRIKNDNNNNNTNKNAYKENDRHHRRSKSKTRWLCCFEPEAVG